MHRPSITWAMPGQYLRAGGGRDLWNLAAVGYEDDRRRWSQQDDVPRRQRLREHFQHRSRIDSVLPIRSSNI